MRKRRQQRQQHQQQQQEMYGGESLQSGASFQLTARTRPLAFDGESLSSPPSASGSSSARSQAAQTAAIDNDDDDDNDDKEAAATPIEAAIAAATTLAAAGFCEPRVIISEPPPSDCADNADDEYADDDDDDNASVQISIDTPRHSLNVSVSGGGGLSSTRDEDDESRLSFIVKEKLHEFARDLRRRTSQVRDDLVRELSPEREDGSDGGSHRSIAAATRRNSIVSSRSGVGEELNSATLPKTTTTPTPTTTMPITVKTTHRCLHLFIPHSIDPHSQSVGNV